MRHGYDSTIVQATDGSLIVRVGCRLVVGSPDDLKMLATYYKGGMPRGFERFKGQDAPAPVVPAPTHLSSDSPSPSFSPAQAYRFNQVGVPPLVVDEPVLVIAKAANGYVLRDPKSGATMTVQGHGRGDLMRELFAKIATLASDCQKGDQTPLN
jgi:hypothetical protein